MLGNATYSVSGSPFFCCSETLKLKIIVVLNFCDLSKLVRIGGNA